MSAKTGSPKRAPSAPVEEVWKLLVEEYGLSYADVRLVCEEVARRAQ